MKRRIREPQELEKHFFFAFIVLIILLFLYFVGFISKSLFVVTISFLSRYYCETGDVQGTLGKMPSYKVRETLVLKALHRHGTDMVCIFLTIVFRNKVIK